MMIASPRFKDKTVFILGLGKSGCSTARALYQAGANVLVWDDQEKTRKARAAEGIPLANLDALKWKEVDYFVLSPGIPHRYPAPHPLAAQAQEAGLSPINDLELLYQSQPQACYMGITGTNGKSTTTSLIAHILKEVGKPVEVGGNLGIPVMDLKPLPPEGTYVLEVSSYQLETAPSLHFNISILLNITPDHLDRHGGFEGYVQSKRLLFQNATVQDTLVISVDDEPCRKIYEELKASSQVQLIPISVERVLSEGIYVKDGLLYETQIGKLDKHTHSTCHPREGGDPKQSSGSDQYVMDSRFRGNDNIINDVEKDSIFDLNSLEHLRGKHNWQNVAAAYGALRVRGLEPQQVMPGITSFPGLAHRQEIIALHKNVLFVNDSKATNAEAVEKVFNSYPEASIYWLLGGRSKEGGIASLTPYFSKIQHGFIFGEATDLFAETLKGHVPYTLCASLEEAVYKAAALAFKEKKDSPMVLLSPACASFDQFKDFEARGHAFCQAVQDVIGGKKCSR
jgi:UDP-N-acetylmuramoylalanine--D-glutamate ligase